MNKKNWETPKITTLEGEKIESGSPGSIPGHEAGHTPGSMTLLGS